jgi:PhnB protein
MTERPTATPAGATAVIPHLVCAGAAAALDFYAAAFDAVEEARMAGPDGTLMHAMTRINGAPVMLMDENPEWGAKGPRLLGGSPVSIHLPVVDVDGAFVQALAAGATPVMEPADQFWGDRYAVVEDPFGHQWSMSQPLPNAPSTPDEMRAAFDATMSDGAE